MLSPRIVQRARRVFGHTRYWFAKTARRGESQFISRRWRWKVLLIFIPRSELRKISDKHELRYRHDQKRKHHEYTDQLLIEVCFSAQYHGPHEHDAEANEPERGNRR